MAYFDLTTAVADLKTGVLTRQWGDWLTGLFGQVTTLQTSIDTVPGVHAGTLAAQPTLGLTNAGYLYSVTDYAHVVRWDGAAWQWFDGDRPGRFEFRATNPGTGFQVCDGTITDYLVVGAATMTVTAFTTPNPTDGTFLKKLAAYTGTLEAAVNTGTVSDTGGGNDMDIFSIGTAAGVQITVRGDTSKFTHLHTPGAPKSLGGLLYFRR